VWGTFGCSFNVYAQYTSINASSLSLTAFTIGRSNADSDARLEPPPPLFLIVRLISVLLEVGTLDKLFLKDSIYRGGGRLSSREYKYSKEAVARNVFWLNPTHLV
jgi:hypothetical protein